MNYKSTILLSIFTMVTLTTSQSSQAGGVIGDLIEIGCGGCGVGRFADHVNAQNGNIFEHGVAAAANSVIPGSGTFLEAGWQVQRFAQNVNAGMPAAAGAGQVGSQYGQYCQLTNGYILGPGQPLPLGSICNDAYGNPGHII